MSREYWLEVTADGVLVDCVAERGVVSLDVDLRPGAQSQAVLSLDPYVDDPVPTTATDWRVYLCHHTLGELPTRLLLLKGAMVRAAHYEEEFTPPQNGQGGGLRQVRRAVIRDKHAAFRDYGPGELVTRKKTSSHAELAFIAERMGFTAVLPSVPSVPIDRIDYTREGGWWSPLAPYFAPWSPQDFIDPDSDSLRLVDTTEIDPDAPYGGTLVADEHFNPLTADVNLGEPVTQAKVTYVLFGNGSGASPAPTDVDEATEISTEPDGSVTTTRTKTAKLHEDPDDPTVTTRTVEIGQGMTRIAADGTPLESSDTTHEFENDYTKLVRSITVRKLRIDLPGGPADVFREVETITEQCEYEDDPERPGRELLTKKTRTTTGIYVYTYTGASVEVDRLTATPVGRGSHSRNVDTASTSSQRWAEGTISTWVENYKRAPGANQVHIWGSETDDLRVRQTNSWSRWETGDNQIAIDGRTRSEYVGTGPRKAVQVDATKIGRDLGLQIANRLISRTEPTVTLSLTMIRPDYITRRLGSLVLLSDPAPRGLAGIYLIQAVKFSAKFPNDGEPNVTQSLELLRSW